jgi:hypothetical protein
MSAAHRASSIGRGHRLAAALLIAGLAVVCALALTQRTAQARVARSSAESKSLARGMSVAAPLGNLDSHLTIARLQYDGGGDWYANPSSIPNLLAAIADRTTLPVERTEARVRLTDERLWDYPFLHVTGHGNIHFSDTEVSRLREYLLRGGFLHVDDNYGLDESFRREMGRVFPDRKLTDVPLSHPIYHLVYEFPRGVPKIHEHDGKPARGYGIFVGDRLAVYYTYSSDLGNGWEDVGTYKGDPPELHEQALRMGVNLFVYAVSSRATP